MIITSQVFEAYLKCPLKCWLQHYGEECAGNIYADWIRNQNESYLIHGTEQLLNAVTSVELADTQTAFLKIKNVKWKFLVGLTASHDNLESKISLVERIPSEGKGRPAQFIPTRFIFTNKLSGDHKPDFVTLSSVI